jgi:hypothetical protein
MLSFMFSPVEIKDLLKCCNVLNLYARTAFPLLGHAGCSLANQYAD